MSFRRFIKVNATDRVLNQIQDNIARALNPVLDNETLDSVVLKDQQLQASKVNAIAHTLGRRLLGWTVVRKNAAADLWEDSVQASPDLLLNLHVSNDVIVDLLVF